MEDVECPTEDHRHEQQAPKKLATGEKPESYAPPLHIPLPFANAAKALMAVDPKQLPSKQAAAKAAPKKAITTLDEEDRREEVRRNKKGRPKPPVNESGSNLRRLRR